MITNLSSLMEIYLNQAVIECSTIELTRHAMKRYIGILGNGTSQADAEMFKNVMAKKLSLTTSRIYCKTLKPFFRWLVSNDYLDSDPFEGVKLCRPQKKVVRFYQPKEIDLMLKNCLDDKMWKVRILLGCRCGLRRGEVLNLTISDIDMAAKLLFVRSKTESKAKGLWKWQTKDYDERVVPITDEVEREVLSLIADLPNGQPYICLRPQRYDHLKQLMLSGLLTDRMRKKPDDAFNREFRRICRKAGASGSFHDLRRTWVTRLLNKLPPHAVMKLAGHSSIETTMSSYAGLPTDLMTLARDAVDNKN